MLQEVRDVLYGAARYFYTIFISRNHKQKLCVFRHALISFIGGVLLHSVLAIHFQFWILLVALGISVLCAIYWRMPVLIYLVLMLIGVTSSNLAVERHSNALLSKQLERKDVMIRGRIVSMPVVKEHYVQFEVSVQSLEYLGAKFVNVKKVRLRDYNAKNQYEYGQYWKMKARLKRPRSYINPGARFDFEKYLFYSRIGAIGYIKKSELIKSAQRDAIFRLMMLRKKWQAFVNQSFGESPYKGLVNALLVGLRDDMTPNQWQVLQNTGTAHLFAISGLHVGFVALISAGMMFFLLSFFKNSARTRPMQDYTLLFAIFISLFYAALAGFSLPTQRALIALLVYAFFRLRRKAYQVLDVCLATIAILLMLDPLSPLSASFWLSCGAVLILLFVVNVFFKQTRKTSLPERLIFWVKLQLALCFFIQPLTYVFFAKAIVVSPLANMLAIPVVTMLLVPLGLISVALFILSQFFGGQWLLGLCYWLIGETLDVMHLIWLCLSFLSELSFASLSLPDFNWLMWTGLLISIILLMSPIRYSKSCAILLLIGILIWRPPILENGVFKVVLLDVGQGLSVVIQTRNFTLLYDTGPAYPSGFNMAQTVIMPYLLSQSIRKIDMLILSHKHNDHSGSWPVLRPNYRVAQKLTGAPNMFESFDECTAGQTWKVDEVKFEIIWPEKEFFAGQKTGGNNDSCVLKISSEYGSVLLTADIEKKVEYKLLKSSANLLDVDVLLVPHQGSQTSSTWPFIKAVSPKLALISSGYLNRFAHPHEKVVNRYLDNHTQVLNTAYHGAIVIKFDRNGFNAVSQRLVSRPYWRL